MFARRTSRALGIQRRTADHTGPGTILALLDEARPQDPAVESTVTLSARGGRLRMRLVNDHGYWATVWVPDTYWFSVTVTGDHGQLVVDEDASADEIRAYVHQQVRVGIRFLLDRPRPRPVGRFGATEIAVTTADTTVYLRSGSSLPGIVWSGWSRVSDVRRETRSRSSHLRPGSSLNRLSK